MDYLEDELSRNGYANVMSPCFQEAIQTKYDCFRNQFHCYDLKFRILNPAEIAVVMIYTSFSEICSDVRWSMLKGDVCKWRYFSSILTDACAALSRFEMFNPPKKLYHGLHDVYLDTNDCNLSRNQFFRYSTFISTSSNKFVAADKFAANDGILFEIENFSSCCDVSWLSMYPDEDEYIIVPSAAIWKVERVVNHGALQMVKILPFGDMCGWNMNCSDLEWAFKCSGDRIRGAKVTLLKPYIYIYIYMSSFVVNCMSSMHDTCTSHTQEFIFKRNASSISPPFVKR